MGLFCFLVLALSLASLAFACVCVHMCVYMCELRGGWLSVFKSTNLETVTVGFNRCIAGLYAECRQPSRCPWPQTRGSSGSGAVTWLLFPLPLLL